MNYLQPHEGITGVDRTDTLLSLEDSNIPTRDLLRGLSRHLGNATLVGNPAPVVRAMSDRIRDPRVGDLVVEMSAAYGDGTTDRALKGLGILLEQRDEWCHTEGHWEELLADGEYESEDDRPYDHAWYIQYGSKAVDVCRWTNCTFTVIPWPDETFTVPAGRREGSAMVFTRDSLLGSLANSGFNLKVGGDNIL